jgi:hypothetical protein
LGGVFRAGPCQSGMSGVDKVIRPNKTVMRSGHAGALQRERPSLGARGKGELERTLRSKDWDQPIISSATVASCFKELTPSRLSASRLNGNLSSRGDRHGQDSIVANATGAVRPVLFQACLHQIILATFRTPLVVLTFAGSHRDPERRTGAWVTVSLANIRHFGRPEDGFRSSDQFTTYSISDAATCCSSRGMTRKRFPSGAMA